MRFFDSPKPYEQQILFEDDNKKSKGNSNDDAGTPAWLGMTGFFARSGDQAWVGAAWGSKPWDTTCIGAGSGAAWATSSVQWV